MRGVEVSKARQVYLVLRERIARGGLAGGHALPGEQALAAEHSVSRITVRRALAELEREGLIQRRRGAGTFVAEHRAEAPVIADLSDVLSNLGGDQRAIDALQRAVDAAQANRDDALTAFRLGGGSRLEAVNSQRILARAQRSLAQAQGQRMGDIVQLYAATATDWRAGGKPVAQ